MKWIKFSDKLSVEWVVLDKFSGSGKVRAEYAMYNCNNQYNINPNNLLCTNVDILYTSI